jgi:hypothetical protein
MRRMSNYKEKGQKMKRSIAIFACAVAAPFFLAQEAGAFPGERVFAKTARVVHKAAYKINQHVVHPVTHGVARRLR